MLDEAKREVRSPFSGFDIIIHFGVGLFAVPFLDYFFFKPFGVELPEINNQIAGDIIGEVISILSILFIIYVIGHSIVFLSGQFIQKPIEACFSKTSISVFFSHKLEYSTRNAKMREFIKKI